MMETEEIKWRGEGGCPVPEEGVGVRIAGVDEGRGGRIAGVEEGMGGRIVGADEGMRGRIFGVEEGEGMCILGVAEGKKRYLDLLLLGDEQESMVDRYLERGELFVLFGTEGAAPLGVAVVTDEGEGVCELKNLAIAPEVQRKGYGRWMVEWLCRHYGHRFRTMLVGTGDSGQTVAFYRRCGFRYSHTLAGFFTEHYDHPIVEEGRVLRDMVCLTRALG